MATENKGVMIYLPKDVEEYITDFCTEYNINRKDKEGNILPSLGTGVVTYLKSKMSGESPDDILAKPSKTLGNGLTRSEVLDLISESITSQSLSDIHSNGHATQAPGLTKDAVLDLINESYTSSLPSAGLTKDAVLDLINESSTSQEIAAMKAMILKLQGELDEVKKFDAIG